MTDLRLRPDEALRICGHRGDMRHAPENTLAAFRRAHDVGAAACEIDIRLTADKKLVVMHDATLDRTTNGSGLIRDQSLDALKDLDAGGKFGTAFAGEPIPLLSEAIELAAEIGIILRVELKDWHSDEDLFPALASVLSDFSEPPLVLCSFDHRQLLELKNTMPGVHTMGISHGRAVDLVGLAQSARLDGLSVQTPAVSDNDIKAMHNAGLAISCYCPINEATTAAESSVTKLRRWSSQRIIDMITVDDVAWLRRSLDDA